MKIAPQFPLVSLSVFHFQCFLWTRFGKEDMPPQFSFLFLSFRYILLLSSFLTHVVEKQHAETLLSSQTCFAWRKGQAFYDAKSHLRLQHSKFVLHRHLHTKYGRNSKLRLGREKQSYHSSKVLERHYIDIYLMHLDTWFCTSLFHQYHHVLLSGFPAVLRISLTWPELPEGPNQSLTHDGSMVLLYMLT